MWGLRMTANLSMVVGSGTGPATAAPVRSAASTICRADWSSRRWSYAFNLMRICWRAIVPFPLWVPELLLDLGDDAGADGAAAFADGGAGGLFGGGRPGQ